MTTRLRVYNNALRYIGERSLASLTETSEARELLDDVWDDNGVDFCLAEGLWKFATRSAKIDYDSTVTVEFGYSRAFSKPSDWVHTVAFCSDEHFSVPVTLYTHENDYWYTDLDIIYVRYVSSHTDYGYALSLWPKTFTDYVSAHFANEIVWDLTSNQETVQKVENLLDVKRKNAKQKDAWNQPQKFPAPGSWATSRNRLSGTSRDRGSRSSLTG